nr:MAG TPA: hypothetical protein [Caudoviricetes sp.]
MKQSRQTFCQSPLASNSFPQVSHFFISVILFNPPLRFLLVLLYFVFHFR